MKTVLIVILLNSTLALAWDNATTIYPVNGGYQVVNSNGHIDNYQRTLGGYEGPNHIKIEQVNGATVVTQPPPFPTYPGQTVPNDD